MYPDATQLHGQYGVLMHETQMIDSRMNLNSLFTAAVDEYVPGMKGITLANYIQLKEFIRDEQGQITGAVLEDTLTNDTFETTCKVAVNCAGIHADTIRNLAEPECHEMQEVI